SELAPLGPIAMMQCSYTAPAPSPSSRYTRVFAGSTANVMHAVSAPRQLTTWKAASYTGWTCHPRSMISGAFGTAARLQGAAGATVLTPSKCAAVGLLALVPHDCRPSIPCSEWMSGNACCTVQRVVQENPSADVS